MKQIGLEILLVFAEFLLCVPMLTWVFVFFLW